MCYNVKIRVFFMFTVELPVDVCICLSVPDFWKYEDNNNNGVHFYLGDMWTEG